MSFTFWRIGLGLRAGTTPETIAKPARSPSRLHRLFIAESFPRLRRVRPVPPGAGGVPNRLGASSVDRDGESSPNPGSLFFLDYRENSIITFIEETSRRCG